MKTTPNRSPDRAERRLVYLSSNQLAALRRLSKRTDTSQAALFRRGIDLVLAEASKRAASKVKS
jgi:Ribbon-helix-helix domain